jgi:hypothetical protein
MPLNAAFKTQCAAWHPGGAFFFGGGIRGFCNPPHFDLRPYYQVVDPFRSDCA